MRATQPNIMIQLPQEFIDRMKKRLGKDFPAFFKSYEEPPAKGLRVNTLKISVEEFLKISPFPLTPVPWEPTAFIYEGERAGAHPYHAAGLYYCQEPSATLPASLLQAKAGERVLDLCAAPGGKATQIACAMQGEGLLVANELDYSRARILSENIERLGVKNAVVTSCDPERLAARLPSFFDKILVDAPCSGEGMFKKEEGALLQWSEANVRGCALRQKNILDSAVKMLAGGGRLVYSTCTFSAEENEDQADALLARYPDLRLLELRRLYPHEVRGEGQFAAVFERKEGDRRSPKPIAPTRNGAAEKAVYGFYREMYGREPQGKLETLWDGRIYLLPEGLPALGVSVLRTGLEVGSFDGKIFKPAHALALAERGALKTMELTCHSEGAERPKNPIDEIAKYLRGEAFPTDVDNGWYAVCVDGFPLGWAKAVNGTLKNHYPKYLRR